MSADAPLYLTLDQGGHATRALVFDGRGRVVARALREVRVFHPQPDWVEQDPDELVRSLNDVILEVRRDLGPRAAQLAAAGLATQRSSIVCWDRISGEALSPVLSWQDRRAHAWLERFAPEAGAIHRSTGLMLSAHYGASKLRWCLDHLPRVARAAADQRLVFGPLAAFLVFRLTEERSLACDPANAARTLLLDLKRLDWDAGLLHLFGVPREALPAVVPSRFDYGRLAAARHLTLSLVAGDQSAALFAYGAPQASNVYLNMGTGAFVQRAVGRFPGHHPRLLSGVVLAERDAPVYVLEGTVNGAGAALAWLAATYGTDNIESELPAWLARAEDPPLFLNGVSGLGSPFWVAGFESKFVGHGDVPGHPAATGDEPPDMAEPWRLAVAVAESIVFLVQANLDEFRQLAPPPERIIAGGGLTHYDALCQRIADLSGLPLDRPVEHEATARGLAWLLAGKPGDWPETGPGRRFSPESNAALAQRYSAWRRAMVTELAQYPKSGS